MAEYDFPEDLTAAQLEMHRTRAAYWALCATLPWSAVPLPGYERPDGHRPPIRREDSPVYTEDQAAEEARLRARMVELSIQSVRTPSGTSSPAPTWSPRAPR